MLYRPGLWSSERFWLALDHTVDPRVNHLEKPKQLIEQSEKFAKEVCTALVDAQKHTTLENHKKAWEHISVIYGMMYLRFCSGQSS